MHLDQTKIINPVKQWQDPSIENDACVKENNVCSQYIPDELLCKVFSCMEKTSLVNAHLVCKQWRKVAYSNELYQQLLEKVAVFPKDWVEYIGVTSGAAFPLTNLQVPRWVLVSERPQAITWIPECVKRVIIKDNGSEEEQCLFLETAEEVGELVANPKQGHATGYDDDSWERALKAKWEVEKSHWEWIDFGLIGQGENYATQESLALGKGNGADVSMRRASIISLLMKKVKFGERCVVFENEQGAYIRFKDKTMIEGVGELRITAGFAPSRLDVTYDCGFAGYFDAVVVARKFFGS